MKTKCIITTRPPAFVHMGEMSLYRECGDLITKYFANGLIIKKGDSKIAIHLENAPNPVSLEDVKMMEHYFNRLSSVVEEEGGEISLELTLSKFVRFPLAISEQLKLRELDVGKPKFFVCGHAHHGKDTVADMMSEIYNLKKTSSTYIALNLFIYPILKEKYNYSTTEECYNDRVNHRTEWHNLISEFNKDMPHRMAGETFIDSDIYCGLRCDVEFQSALANISNVHSLWIDAIERLPPEPYESNKITQQMCQYYINNNGTDPNLVKEQLTVIEHYLK